MKDEFIRSPFSELEGFPWLARVIDKVRSESKGTLEDRTPYPSGIDREFINLLGLDAESLRQVINGSKSDSEIVAWVKSNSISDASEKMESLRKAMIRPCPAAFADEFAQEIADRSANFPELDFSKALNFIHVICIEEGHVWPAP